MAYDAAMSMTDAESFNIDVEIIDLEVNLLDYRYSYSLKGCGVELTLPQGNGLTVDLDERLIMIDPGASYRLQAGSYEHGLIQTEIDTSKVVQLFTGTVTVTRSPNA